MLIFKGSKSTWNDGKDAVYQTICNGRYGCYNGKWIDFAEKLFYEETAKRFFDQMNINSNETKFSLDGKENNTMKSLFERAINIRHGCLESRLVARMETEGRELTDEETANELEYLAETIPYAGLDKEYEKEIMAAIRYLKKYY